MYTYFDQAIALKEKTACLNAIYLHATLHLKNSDKVVINTRIYSSILTKPINSTSKTTLQSYN